MDVSARYAGHTDSGFVAVLNKAADAFAGALAGKVVDPGEAGVVGSLEFLAGLGIVLAAQEVLNLLTANCDGQVASGSFEFTAKQLAEMVQPGATFPFTKPNPGSDSPAGCGSENSEYDVTYQIARNTEAQIQELRLEKTGWAQASLSSIVSNAPPAFPLEAGSPLTAFWGATTSPACYMLAWIIKFVS